MAVIGDQLVLRVLEDPQADQDLLGRADHLGRQGARDHLVDLE